MKDIKGGKPVEDKQIIELYFARDELAVSATQEKYGGLLSGIALKILGESQAAEECINDVYLSLWRTIPPESPDNLRAYSCKIVRNTAFNQLRYSLAEKRSVHAEISLDELEETLSDGISPQAFENVDFKIVVNEFLEGLKPEARKVFLKRYFFLDTVPQIAADMGISESKVKSLLFRARARFKSHILGKEKLK